MRGDTDVTRQGAPSHCQRLSMAPGSHRPGPQVKAQMKLVPAREFCLLFCFRRWSCVADGALVMGCGLGNGQRMLQGGGGLEKATTALPGRYRSRRQGINKHDSGRICQGLPSCDGPAVPVSGPKSTTGSEPHCSMAPRAPRASPALGAGKHQALGPAQLQNPEPEQH